MIVGKIRNNVIVATNTVVVGDVPDDGYVLDIPVEISKVRNTWL